MTVSDEQRSRPPSPDSGNVAPPHEYGYTPHDMLDPDYTDCTCSWARSDASACHYLSDGAIGPGGETVCGRCDDHHFFGGCECDCDGCCITVSRPQMAEHKRLCEARRAAQRGESPGGRVQTHDEISAILKDLSRESSADTHDADAHSFAPAVEQQPDVNCSRSLLTLSSPPAQVEEVSRRGGTCGLQRHLFGLSRRHLPDG
jgi:hypothetical protein